MKRILISAFILASFASTAQYDYPETKKGEVSYEHFGTTVKDPYRWLEDDMASTTADWVEAQNACTFKYLDQIPYRGEIKERLSKMQDYERIGTPWMEGKYEYYSKNDGLQNQSVYYRRFENGKEELFLDPNKFSADGTTSLGTMSFTKDGSIMAYSISEGGSDWRKIIVIDAETKKQIEDTLYDVKFSGISWLKNEGFFYSSYDKPEGSELSAKTDQHKLFYHKLGTSQKEDKLIFGGSDAQKRRYVGGYVSDDARYLFISASVSTTGNELYMLDLEKDGAELVTVLDNFETDSWVMDNKEDKLFIVTNLNAPNNRIVTVSANDPAPNNWVDFIPETENVLSPNKGGGYIFASYMKDAISQILQYDYEGKLIRDIELPGLGSAGGFGGKKDQKTLYYSFTNYHTPGSSYAYDPATGKSILYWQPEIDFDPTKYESKQVFYESKDGTKIPMIITYKKGVELNGKNPTILYGYGGFNVSLTPYYSNSRAIWMDLGGVYAVANLRGGGEYGQKWHNAGTQMNKQNVFDDFIAAGEWLIKNKYTSSEYLAIQGGSNGGLLVGAVMTQRPDLMRVALPAVGVLDMLRYHTFTAGAGWAYDYGTAEDSPEMFQYLLNYSPVHNVKDGMKYPATLVTTGDHDDRVVPAHSYKFIAELQDKHAGDLPVMIRIETNAGHGAGTPISKRLEQGADIMSFVLWNMGYKELPK